MSRARAGIQGHKSSHCGEIWVPWQLTSLQLLWIPAFAGMTVELTLLDAIHNDIREHAGDGLGGLGTELQPLDGPVDGADREHRREHGIEFAAQLPRLPRVLDQLPPD